MSGSSRAPRLPADPRAAAEGASRRWWAHGRSGSRGARCRRAPRTADIQSADPLSPRKRPKCGSPCEPVGAVRCEASGSGKLAACPTEDRPRFSCAPANRRMRAAADSPPQHA
jgi:hypothetical protein